MELRRVLFSCQHGSAATSEPIPLIPIRLWKAQRVEANWLALDGTGASAPLKTINGMSMVIKVNGAEAALGESAEANRPRPMPVITANTRVTYTSPNSSGPPGILKEIYCKTV